MKQARIVGIQYAALPYRIEGRQVQVLLITSRETRRWVIPKGWPIRRLSPQDVAAQEAAEEAGVYGEIEPAPVGSYRYLKRLKGERTTAVQVIVFPLLVQEHAAAWKEQSQRAYAWFRYQRAAALVDEPALGRLIRDLGGERTPTLLAHGLRSYRAWRIGVRSRPALG